MKKQRICIVGDGLSGLMAALALNKIEGLEVDLISKKNRNSKDKRTTAISASNYEFFNKVIDKLDKKLFWPSKKIDLFYETKDQNMNFLNFNEDSKNLMYVFENDKIKEILIIVNKGQLDQYKKIIPNGKNLGIKITYAEQSTPKGLPDAFILGKKFIGKESVALILGDNFFYGQKKVSETQQCPNGTFIKF